MRDKLSNQERAAELVSRMTLAEKVSQMVFDAPAIERLGIPEYNWWNECLHGVARAGAATVFPQAIGLAATWNTDLVQRIAEAISDEARAKHHQALRRNIRQIYSGLTHWSPNVNIFRDPRWGRGQETYGEDPCLTASMGVAFVRGLQGDDPGCLKLAATPKHYAVHSGPELNRHSFDARVGERDLRETYLPAFEACVREGRAASVMGCYNRVNGEPGCASPTLLQKILIGEWGFDGYVVSDCGAIYDIYAHHQVVGTAEEAAALAVNHGCDLECGAVYPALLEAVEQGLISEATIDRALERVFAARFRLGMFDPPEGTPYAQIPYEVVNSPEHRALALEAARESMVLLKNEGGLLPLSRDVGAIAVVGPNADDLSALQGNYNGTPVGAVTPLDGIRRKVGPSTRVYHALGSAWTDGAVPLKPIPPDCLRPGDIDWARAGLKAEYYDNPRLEGEPRLTRIDPAVDWVWADTTPLTGQWGDSFSVRWTGFLTPPVSGVYRLGVNGHNGYRLVLDGELLAEHQGVHEPALTTRKVELEAGRLYPLRLEYVSWGLDPQARLVWAPPGADLMAEALEAAGKADVVVAVMGLSPRFEGEEMPVRIDGFAGGDRIDIALPEPQEALLKELAALGKPLVLALLNGSALAVNWAAEHVPAIVEAWYPGQAGGEALADVLFGDYNPGGRLPVTFYRSVEDLPPFEDYAMEGRTYRYFRGEPLYPFGHGLSYTTFEYDNLTLSRRRAGAGERVDITLRVTNSGPVAGDEVVQL
ncbi:MAG: glycoside hydrolase family 3 C-terminal domain-containing protein, partial [Anaerolineae bacterium]|nr:glycoside hydrolase family 3 C-terminal domain-containing protein [Anaerolineae bacterium]